VNQCKRSSGRASRVSAHRIKEAFQIGFLIYIPFPRNRYGRRETCSWHMGMQMISPATVSCLFKLLIFVLVEAGTLLAKALVVGYIDVKTL